MNNQAPYYERMKKECFSETLPPLSHIKQSNSMYSEICTDLDESYTGFLKPII